MASSNVASEVKSAVSKLNDHLATALTGGSDEARNGATTNIITLSGENSGATMEAAGDVEDLVVVEAGDGDGDEEGSVLSAYTNSNYQAVNNSVFVAGTCAVKDPGVHVVIVEHVDEISDYDDVEEGEVAN